MSDDRARVVLEAVAGKRPTSKGWVRANCPFCATVKGTPDRKGCLGLNVESGKWHCYRCLERGCVEDSDAVRSSTAPKPRADDKAPYLGPPGDWCPLFEEPAASALSCEDARRYVLRRRISVDVARRARLGVCLDGKAAGRVVVPILDDAGQWRGWVGRAWSKTCERKYIYPSGMDRAGTLYNRRVLDVDTDAPALVVEGVFDTFPFFDEAVAVLGKPSGAQVDMLAAARRPIAVVLDGDAWGEGEALALELRLRGKRAGFVKLAARVDPDEVDPGELRAAALRCLDVT